MSSAGINLTVMCSVLLLSFIEGSASMFDFDQLQNLPLALGIRHWAGHACSHLLWDTCRAGATPINIIE